jgi:hypothetical protein
VAGPQLLTLSAQGFSFSLKMEATRSSETTVLLTTASIFRSRIFFYPENVGDPPKRRHIPEDDILQF